MGKYLNVIKAWYFTGKNIKAPDKRTPAKLRKEYRFEYFSTDSGSHFFDDVEYSHQVNSIIVTKPGQSCSAIGRYGCHSVVFNSPDEEFRKQYLDVLPTLINTPDANFIIKIFDDIVLAVFKYGKDNIYTEGLMLQLIHELYYYSQVVRSDNKKYSMHDRQLADAVHFMTLNISGHIDTDDIASSAYMSRSYFCHVFKNVYGVTPARYLLKLRLQKAQILLLNTSLSISEIAESCGFPSQQYMTYAFKRAFGMTPRQYVINNYQG